MRTFAAACLLVAASAALAGCAGDRPPAPDVEAEACKVFLHWLHRDGFSPIPVAGGEAAMFDFPPGAGTVNAGALVLEIPDLAEGFWSVSGRVWVGSTAEAMGNPTLPFRMTIRDPGIIVGGPESYHAGDLLERRFSLNYTEPYFGPVETITIDSLYVDPYLEGGVFIHSSFEHPTWMRFSYCPPSPG